MTWIDEITAALDSGRDIELEDERNLPSPDGSHRPAAVLIPITDRPEPGVILTQRPSWLHSHPGQVAFPGGKVDEGDADAVAAALREAHEELAIPPEEVRVIGVTDTYYSGSGYEIIPVIGVVPPDLPLVPNPGEVEDWFEVPLAFLLDCNNVVQREVDWAGQTRKYYDIQWHDRRIWGVTAGIIANLARRLEQGRLT